jgi:hypothetical protein
MKFTLSIPVLHPVRPLGFLCLFLTLSLVLACKTEQKKDYFEIKLSDRTVIEISPDSTQLEAMIQNYAEEDFYTMVDDVMWYSSQMRDVMDSLNIKYIYTDKRFVKIVTPKDQITIDNDSSKVKWRYIYFNGNFTQEKDIFELINLKTP